jgi:acetyl esterase/lipase
MGRGIVRVIVGVGLGMLTICGVRADSKSAVEVAAAPVVGDRYPRAVVAFGDDVQSYPDLVYSTPPGFRPLRLDLYKPKEPVGALAERPLVIYVHGGGWRSGHTRHAGAFANWPNVLAALASKGYVVASVEYRLSGEARFPAAIHDVKTAVRWLRSKARDFGVDRTRVVIWGGSAGAHLAALTATSCGVDSLAPTFLAHEPGQPASSAGLETQSDRVQGLVAWYGVFDLARIPQLSAARGDRNDTEAPPAERFLGCLPSSCAATSALASPVTYVDARDPPALLVHGDRDRVVPVEQSRAFSDALQSKNVSARLLIIPDVDHSFIGLTPEKTREASLAALSATFAFIDATIGADKRP